MAATPISAGEPLGEHRVRLVADPRVARQLEVGPGAGQGIEAGGRQAGPEEVALALVEVREVEPAARVGHVVGERRAAPGVFTVKTTNWWTLRNSAMSSARRERPPHLPPGDVEGLPEGAHHEGAGRELGVARHALVPGPVEDDVLVDLVGDHHDPGAAGEPGERVQVLPAQDRAGRVVRAVHQDHPRARRDEAAGWPPSRAGTRAGRERGAHGPSPGQHHRRDVRVVDRLEDDDLVARGARARSPP